MANDRRQNAYGQPVAELCFRREDDELLALGYPHRIDLVDDALDTKRAVKLAAKAGYDVTIHNTTLRVRFPRRAAPHFVRGARAKEFQDWTRQTKPPDTAFTDGSPVSADEARELVCATLAVTGCAFNRNHRAFFYVLEALVGTDVVALAILSALEALDDKRFTHESGPDRKTGGAIFVLGFMLLRLSPRERAASTARLRALLDRAHAACNKAKSTAWEVVCAMEEVLDGWRATRLATKPTYSYAQDYIFATDDLDRLRAVIADRETMVGALDVRFVYLLGPEVIDTLGKRRPAKWELPIMFEDLGKIRHAGLVPLFLEYVGKPMAKDLPLQWFRAHADFARPILESMHNDKARTILSAL